MRRYQALDDRRLWGYWEFGGQTQHPQGDWVMTQVDPRTSRLTVGSRTPAVYREDQLKGMQGIRSMVDEDLCLMEGL